tara:strand:- start:5021 stop:5692 length:672 start_codon:yes stop_codon:yes gene_type:complete
MMNDDRLRVVEVFTTVQGEGTQAGAPAVFVRLTGCNLWAGTEATRSKGRGGCASWCDTQFAQGDSMTVDQVVQRVGECAQGMAAPLVVLTGGEPMLQLKREQGRSLVNRLTEQGYALAIETNGTIATDFDHPVHVTVSPKPENADPSTLTHIAQRGGDTLKVVWPTTLPLDEMNDWPFTDKYLQPRDIGEDIPGSTHLDDCITEASRLGWRVSFQTHKMVGLA